LGRGALSSYYGAKTHTQKKCKQTNVVKKYPLLLTLPSEIEPPDEADIFVQPLHEEEQCVLATSDDTEEERVTTSSQSSQQSIPEEEISVWSDEIE